jgi:hypothetical protein
MAVRQMDVTELGQAATGAVTDAIPKGMAVTSRAVTRAARDCHGSCHGFCHGHCHGLGSPIVRKQTQGAAKHSASVLKGIVR